MGTGGVGPRRDAGTRSERVRELIEEGIATGEFPPGMRLDETELSQRFDDCSLVDFIDPVFVFEHVSERSKPLRQRVTGRAIL